MTRSRDLAHLSESLGKENLVVRRQTLVILNSLQHGDASLSPLIVLFRETGHLLLPSLEQKYSLLLEKERERETVTK